MSSVGAFQLAAPPFPSSSSSFSKTTPSLRLLPFPISSLQRHAILNRNFQRRDAVSIGQISRSGRKFGSLRCFSALSPELKTTIDKVVTSEKVVLFMKGSKDFPQCGFSNTVVQILKSLNVTFETINILENEVLRQGLKEYSSWPTFPQLYIDGEFFGGCDITVEAYKSGELQEVLEKAMCS
ncbi:monothiol glutaredoxin-S7, chloroplastic isoform X2 [Momordica charantia]|uniref:Monothiol glutaredoxin-S7, chloroplastic isoform X2 n=1 Tax=Momordica charantia TaxID=3673 RepID=A0A6J1D7S5_MOMCH|nr:monothiol glutaredoxin-S7, chloroplastic isoform X2 [Momordica charantia]